MSEESQRVLIVDDQGNWRDILTILLERGGFVVSQAKDFNEASELIHELDFAVVVLDVRLIDEDTFNVGGLELLRLVKGKRPNTRTIILTGYPESIPQEVKADAIILKVPEGSIFDRTEFMNQVRNLARSSPMDAQGN